MSTDDRTLLRRWLNDRDPEAFKEIVNRYANMVYGACKRILRNDADAEDATQESFLALARGTRDIKSLGPWLHTVATRRALDRLRSIATRRKVEDRFADHSPRLETSVWDDLQGFVDEAIADLPEELRTVLIGHFLLQKTHNEVAAELGVSRQTITYRQKKAIERVRAYLDKRGIGVSVAVLSSTLLSNASEAAPQSILPPILKLALTPAKPLPGAARPARGFRSGTALAMAGAALVLAFIVLIFLRGGETEEVMARTTIGDDGGVPGRLESSATEVVTRPVAPAQPMMVAAYDVVTTDLSGRVYDSDTDEGLPAVVIHLKWADPVSQTLESIDIETDANGHYSITNLALGAYTVAIDPIENYSVTLNGGISREIVLSQAGTRNEADFPLAQGGTLVGVVMAGTNPVRNSTISIRNYFDNDHLHLPDVATDEEGRYRVTGLADFTGILRASRTRDDGVSQASTQLQGDVIVITAGTTTTADFTFPGGGASIEGHVYFIDESQPIIASLHTYYINNPGDRIASTATDVSTDENGYYRIDNLPAGILSLQVHAHGTVSGSITDVAVLEEGELTRHDIIFGDSRLLCRFYNIPEGTKHVIVSVESGFERPVEKLTRLDFVNSVGDTVSWAHVNFNAQEPTSTLGNLKPGDYTVRASSLPTRWNVADFVEMGWDTFLSRIISTRVYFTIESFSETVEVDLDFDLVEAWHTRKVEEATE